MGIPLRWRKAFDPTTFIVAALLLLPCSGEAAPQQLNCMLTTAESVADPNFTEAEQRAIAITVDREANTITVLQDGSAQALDHVTFALSINGYTKTLSVGMDAASGDIVIQSYGPNASKAEFGTCTPK